MARRKNEHPIEVLFEMITSGPIWLGPIIIVVVLVLGLLVLPPIIHDPKDKIQVGQLLGPFIKNITWVLAGGLTIVWIAVCAKRLFTRRTFDSHTDIESIRQLSWRQFESYIGEAFRREGYFVEETGDPAGDGGVDLVLHKNGQKTLVQCKHWKAFKVGVQPVRELLGVVTSEGAQAGIMATSGHFTSEAREFAQANRIRLIDGEALEELVQSIHDSEPSDMPGERPSHQATSISKRTSSSPACPRCGQPMQVKTARRGVNAGNQFWGCTDFPDCKGTRPI